ncbi:protein kinase domain-containing protein [Nonomuraea sediminis]|uniref:protein kinase domain-containing protein n=1 Tax=Nonomuraea sediminis TaxID=2835864 RepID=UPI001BDD5708|nr:serine/threonine-protein kinase [Nonomuraea sediminis]
MRVIAGRYQLLAPLGAGGAGTVWRARDEVLHREVAVKEVRLPPGRDRDRARVDTLREARAAAALNHPSIITVHDVIDEGGQPWIIMDLLTGSSLGDLVKQRGPLPVGQVATVGLRVLDALEAAHHRGILHRDVKPGNVMITESGEVVLTDFGIASHTGDVQGAATAAAAAHLGNVPGSPGYIAPELLRGEQGGPLSDLWSLGATLFTAAEGRPPFDRDSTMAVIASVLTAPAPQPLRAGPLGGLLLAMLAKDPGMRPHPQAIRATLQPLAAPLPVRAREMATVPTLPVRARKSRAPLIVAGAVVLAAVGVTAVVLVDRGAEPPPRSQAKSGIPTPAEPPPATSAAPSQAPTSAAPPTVLARGDGKFGQPPAACDLITDEQAQEILPGSHSRQDQVYDDSACNWLAGVQNASIKVKVTYADTVEKATTAFARTRQTQQSKTGKSEKTETLPVQRLDLGDQAFVQDRRESWFNSSASTVWLRVSNVVVKLEIYYEHDYAIKKVHPLAVKAARTVADNLQKAT